MTCPEDQPPCPCPPPPPSALKRILAQFANPIVLTLLVVSLQVPQTFAEMLDTLHSFHAQGIVHRDIKPANCLRLREPAPGDLDTIKVLDFGLARLDPALQRRLLAQGIRPLEPARALLHLDHALRCPSAQIAVLPLDRARLATRFTAGVPPLFSAILAEAAYQAVRVTQPCENPGSPRLEARVHDGFVYGYTASNSGSCHSGWFSKLHVYNRSWRLVAKQEYSE